MNDINSILHLLVQVFSLFGLWLIYFVFLPNYLIDSYRQKMFEVRNSLFLYATDGNIDFKHPSYVKTRNVINILIRFAHRLTIVEVFLMFIFSSKEDFERSSDLQESYTDLPAEAQTEMRGYMREVGFLTLSLMAKRSMVILLVILIPFVLWAITRKSYRKLMNIPRKMAANAEFLMQHLKSGPETFSFAFRRIK